MSGLRVIKKSNKFGKIARAFPDEVSKIIGKGAMDIQSVGQQFTPIGPTGNLQNNVVNSYRPGDHKATVTWTMDYAAYVEFGTYKMAGRFYARDAAKEVWPSVKAALEQLEKRLPT